MTRKAQDDRPILPPGKLSAVTVRSLTKPGLYADGLGLYLQVSKWKSKSWIYRFMVDGKAHKFGLGACHTVSLSEAREAALQARSKLHRGIDPIAERKAALGRLRAETAKLVSFRECAEQYIESNRAAWRNAKSEGQWRSSLVTYAFPILGDLPVASVDTALVVKVLEPIWQTKTETASRLRGRIESILDYAKARRLRDDGPNPASWKGGGLKAILPAPGKVAGVKRHHAALDYSDVPAFMPELRATGGLAAAALEFTILTAARVGETLGARWSEIDLAKKVWTIAGERMKSGNPHTVPLSSRAVQTLEGLPRTGETIFATHNVAMSRVLRTLRPGVTIHGFRSSFRDWCGDETHFPREVAEAALAHATGDETERAYRRGTALEQRRKLMDAWSAYCERPAAQGGNIVAIGGRA
jgi:integrase